MENQKFKAGFHIGGFADYRFNASFSIRPELLYTTLGSKEKNPEPSVGFEDYIGKYDYLSLPIMARYHFSGVPGLSVAAGPYVSFLLSAKIKGESGNQSAEFDVKDVTKSIDFGLGAGVAYEFIKRFLRKSGEISGCRI